MPETNAPEGVWDTLKQILESLTLTGVLLYIAGWSYLYGFYRRFGVSIKELDINTYDAYLFAMKVIRAEWLVVTLVVAVWIVAMSTKIRSWRAVRAAATLVPVAAAVVLASYGLLYSGLRMGSDDAGMAMQASSCRLPYVSLQLDPAKMPTQLLDNGLADEQTGYVQLGYKLLLHTKGRYYLFTPVTDIASGDTEQRELVIVPEDAVRGLVVMGVYCGVGLDVL